jgi:hypothetical protein
MKERSRSSNTQIEVDLVEDSKNPDAWDSPVRVPPSKAPRPKWYGDVKHLELAAKFYVLSVLHRLGVEASLTIAQPDNVDIAAVLQSGEAFTIDVKTLAGTSQWPVEKFTARKHHFLVFVCYQRKWRDLQLMPDLYIWKSEPLKAVINQQKTTSVSLKDLASKLDPTAAWQQFAA